MQGFGIDLELEHASMERVRACALGDGGLSGREAMEALVALRKRAATRAATTESTRQGSKKAARTESGRSGDRSTRLASHASYTHSPCVKGRMRGKADCFALSTDTLQDLPRTAHRAQSFVLTHQTLLKDTFPPCLFCFLSSFHFGPPPPRPLTTLPVLCLSSPPLFISSPPSALLLGQQ